MKLYIQNYLLKLGVRPNLLGFDYLTKAIEYYNPTPPNKSRIMEIYQKIADEYGETVVRVERAIRLAITKCFEENKNIFGALQIIPCKVTNSQFIALCALNLEREHYGKF